MKGFWPLFLIAAGLLVVFIGFLYDVEFAGIPYQDPTPEMTARYNHYAHIASLIRWFGFGHQSFLDYERTAA
jgi:hypothetical protein